MGLGSLRRSQLATGPRGWGVRARRPAETSGRDVLAVTEPVQRATDALSSIVELDRIG